jgi:hypothetical protein
LRKRALGALMAAALLLAGPQPAAAGDHEGYHGYGHGHGGYGWVRRPFLRPRIVFGGYYGPPILWPRRFAPFYGYGGPPYAAPPVVIEQPPVFVQQPDPPAYWYYCQDPQGYYPYVPQCATGWMQVVPPQGPPS